MAARRGHTRCMARGSNDDDGAVKLQPRETVIKEFDGSYWCADQDICGPHERLREARYCYESRNAATPEERFKNLVREMLACGVHPTPTRLNLARRRKLHRMSTLPGNELRWRREVLEQEHGYRFDERTRRFKKPPPSA